jgi:hypothetical protein
MENLRSDSSQAIASVLLVRVKSILGVSLKVKESIKDPFVSILCWLHSG